MTYYFNVLLNASYTNCHLFIFADVVHLLERLQS